MHRPQVKHCSELDEQCAGPQPDAACAQHKEQGVVDQQDDIGLDERAQTALVEWVSTCECSGRPGG